MPTETRPDRELRKTEEFTINTQGSFRKKKDRYVGYFNYQMDGKQNKRSHKDTWHNV